MSRWCLTPVALLVLIALAPAGASAAINIYENSEEATYLGQINKVKCKLKKAGQSERFRAQGRTSNGVYGFEVIIYDFTSFRREYNVTFGGVSPTVNLEGAGQDYSNNYPFPGGQPPFSAGAIDFKNRGAKIGLGVYGLPNFDYSKGVALAGAAKCQNRRRR